MTGQFRNPLLVLIILTASQTQLALAQEKGIINNSQSPHSKLRSVNLEDVKWTDGFWKEKFDLVKDVTIPKMWEFYNDGSKTDDGKDAGFHWVNFRIAAGLQEGVWRGTSWHDGDLYKWVEAVAYVYSVTRDPKLDRQMDEVIEIIGKAQQPDGYLSTQIILEKRKRFENIHHHELYNMGHLMTAACIHHRITGKDNFLKLARKTGDYLYDTFKTGQPELAPFGFNPSNIMGAVELYRTTGDKKYLELANIFINNRGTCKVGKTISQEIADQHTCKVGSDLTQDRVPLRNESFAVGHAVTATYLYGGAADAYMESGDQKLFGALNRIWNDVTSRKMYIHGGVGPFTHGMSIRHDLVHEAFGDEYSLPNRKSYCETCACIGNGMWNWRMLNITSQGQYTDVMERVWYNSGIAGLGLDGDTFLYTNVLRRFGKEVPLLRSDRLTRWKERKGYCCPPQLARTIARMHGYVYSTSKDSLWVHLYGSNILKTTLENGTSIQLRQSTKYPWEGQIKLTFESVSDAQPLKLQLHIPDWANGASIRINGKPAKIKTNPGQYASLQRSWAAGDVVELNLPMKARLVRANPLVEELRGQVAVMRGPIVYCLESVDLPGNTDVMDVLLPSNIELKARFDKNLLGGVTVLEGKGISLKNAGWTDGSYHSRNLYQDVTDFQTDSISLKLIPYYSWLNRGTSMMSIWLPVDMNHTD